MMCWYELVCHLVILRHWIGVHRSSHLRKLVCRLQRWPISICLVLPYSVPKGWTPDWAAMWLLYPLFYLMSNCIGLIWKPRLFRLNLLQLVSLLVKLGGSSSLFLWDDACFTHVADGAVVRLWAKIVHQAASLLIAGDTLVHREIHFDTLC